MSERSGRERICCSMRRLNGRGGRGFRVDVLDTG
jgi:hypothetical protein